MKIASEDIQPLHHVSQRHSSVGCCLNTFFNGQSKEEKGNDKLLMANKVFGQIVLMLQSAWNLHHSFRVWIWNMSDEMFVIYSSCTIELSHDGNYSGHNVSVEISYILYITAEKLCVCSIIWTHNFLHYSHYVIKLLQSKDKLVFKLSTDSLWSHGAPHLFSLSQTPFWGFLGALLQVLLLCVSLCFGLKINHFITEDFYQRRQVVKYYSVKVCSLEVLLVTFCET